MPRALKFFNPRLRDCVDEPRQNQVFHSFTTCLTNESDEKIESGVFSIHVCHVILCQIQHTECPNKF